MRAFFASFTAFAVADIVKVVPVFQQADPNINVDGVFNKTFESFMADFQADEHSALMTKISQDVSSYIESAAFAGASNCGTAAGTAVTLLPSKISAFPGGSTKRIFGMDCAKLVDALASKATGAAGAQGAAPALLAAQAITTGAGLVKSAMSNLLQIVPIAVTGSPLQCMPMVTGHNCFGAVQYPITTSDFVTADTTDSQLDGVISGFPALYKRKVGTTSDAAYKACFSAYMGMHCGSLFPRCSGPKDAQVQRLPLCFSSCLATLVACPGFWIDTIAGECSEVSVPPMCAMANFANFWLLPPQYTSYENSVATESSCPTPVASFDTSGLNIYDDSSIIASPYGAGKLPVA